MVSSWYGQKARCFLARMALLNDLNFNNTECFWAKYLHVSKIIHTRCGYKVSGMIVLQANLYT
jgi:hypothetical protein